MVEENNKPQYRIIHANDPIDGYYWEFIRTLRNHSKLKPGFLKQEHISVEEHAAYMERNGRHYYVCLDHEDTPLGFVGVVEGDIRIAVHPDHQNKGVASFMLERIKTVFPTAKAKIKVENEASLKLFQKAGYKVKCFLLELEQENATQPLQDRQDV
jgi:GNAT superfamily N-acetyltransferase